MGRSLAALFVIGALTTVFGGSALATPACPQGLVRYATTGLCAAALACPATRIRDASGACVCPGGTASDGSSGLCRDTTPSCRADQVLDADTHRCVCASGASADAKGICRTACPAGQTRTAKGICAKPRRR